jgi:uncharacterized membrane protein required for colicin V production
MLRAAFIVFLLSLLVGLVGSFFFGNSFRDIGYSNQNFIGGIIGLVISGLLFIMGSLSLVRSHRAVLESTPMIPMTSTPVMNPNNNYTTPVMNNQTDPEMNLNNNYTTPVMNNQTNPEMNLNNNQTNHPINNQTNPPMMSNY